jgi:DNA-directed RNA polymerase specialized sigma24 family protein
MTTSGNPFEEFLMRLERQASSPADAYVLVRVKLFKLFLWNRCSPEDSEELADEVIKRLVSITNGENTVDKPWGFVKGVAANVLKEHWRKAARLAPLDEIEPIGLLRLREDEDFASCARHCMAKLPDDKRRLLERYYSDEGSRPEQAQGMGLSLAALRLKIHRLKVDLRECYEKCAKPGKQYEEGN